MYIFIKSLLVAGILAFGSYGTYRALYISENGISSQKGDVDLTAKTKSDTEENSRNDNTHVNNGDTPDSNKSDQESLSESASTSHKTENEIQSEPITPKDEDNETGGSDDVV